MTVFNSTSPASHVQWFRHAAPYIRSHRGKCFVVVFNVDILHGDFRQDFVHDVALLSSLGVHLVLIQDFGGRVPSSFDDAAFAKVQADISSALVEFQSLLSMGLAHSPLAGAQLRVVSGNYVTARPLGVVDGVEQAHVGRVRRVDVDGLKAQFVVPEHVVVLPSLGFSPTGSVFYVPASHLAAQVAVALEADKLLCLTGDVWVGDGSLVVPGDLSLAECQAFVGNEVLSGELRSYLGAAAEACELFDLRVHVLDYREPECLLAELFTSQGAGTLVSRDGYSLLRAACLDDVGGILALTSPLEEQGVLVARTREYLESAIGDFFVIELDGLVVGCAALHCFEESHSAEVACFVIHPDFQKCHWGAKLLAFVEARAASLKVSRLVLLTTQAHDWFLQHGFEVAEFSDLPMARQALYNVQRGSKILCKGL